MGSSSEHATSRISSELRRNPVFTADVLRQFSWYVHKAGEDVAWRFEAAVEETLLAIAKRPDFGQLRHFKNARLAQLRSIPVTRPFNKLIIFYRAEGDTVEAWRDGGVEVEGFLKELR